MFKSILNFLKNLFVTTESQSDRIKRLAYIAGVLIKLNNPNYAILASALKIALNSIESGKEENIDTEVLKTLVSVMGNSKNPEVVTAITLVLAEFNITNIVSTDKKFDLPLIKALVMGLLEGLS